MAPRSRSFRSCARLIRVNTPAVSAPPASRPAVSQTRTRGAGVPDGPSSPGSIPLGGDAALAPFERASSSLRAVWTTCLQLNSVPSCSTIMVNRVRVRVAPGLPRSRRSRNNSPKTCRSWPSGFGAGSDTARFTSRTTFSSPRTRWHGFSG